MRPLFCIPIVHSPEDMGGLRESVENSYVRNRGKAQWDNYLQSVDALWTQIRQMIDGLGLDWPSVRLYQDGLPVCGHEETIVRELAEKGSPNHLLLLDLMNRKARLTGTESPQLLIEEYELNRQVLEDRAKTGRAAGPSAQVTQRARNLLDKRDQFIAEQIAQTLEPGEQGLIFLGMLHSLQGRLRRDIQLSLLRPGDLTPPLGQHR